MILIGLEILKVSAGSGIAARFLGFLDSLGHQGLRFCGGTCDIGACEPHIADFYEDFNMGLLYAD